MATTIALVLHSYSSSVCVVVGKEVISWIYLPSYSSSSLLICLSFLITLPLRFKFIQYFIYYLVLHLY